MPSLRPTYHRPRGLPAGLASLLCVLALAASASAATPESLVVEGAGEGHGVGMSQDGALGLATHGYAYQQILAHYYTGTTIGQAAPGTVVKVLVGSRVKKVPLERYVRGVIGAEMSPSWPLAALEAQAVASRTYALTAHAGGSRFDVYADSRSQVYRGAAAESASTDAAVSATAGQIVEYAGKPAITYFFASSGGMTESVQYGFPGSEPEPWLVAVADPYETTSSHWKIEMPLATAARRLHGLFRGHLIGIEVLRRGVSPRVLSARVMGSAGADVLSGPELAGRLGLPSTWDYFDLRSSGGLRPEPDHSGRARTWTPEAPAPPPVQPGPAGGVAPAATSPATAAGAAGGTTAG